MNKPKTNILKTLKMPTTQDNTGAKDTTQEKVTAVVSFLAYYR